VRKPPGSVWRIKYDEPPARRGGMYGPSHSLLSADYVAALSTDERVPVRTILDEVVLAFPGGSIHLEQMNDRQWFLGVGEDKWMITIGGDGAPKMGERYT